VKKSECENTEIWKDERIAKAQDTRASPKSLDTHLARKWGDIGHLYVGLRALSSWNSGWIDC